MAPWWPCRKKGAFKNKNLVFLWSSPDLPTSYFIILHFEHKVGQEVGFMVSVQVMLFHLHRQFSKDWIHSEVYTNHQRISPSPCSTYAFLKMCFPAFNNFYPLPVIWELAFKHERWKAFCMISTYIILLHGQLWLWQNQIHVLSIFPTIQFLFYFLYIMLVIQSESNLAH